MPEFLQEIDNLKPETLKFIGTVVTATATIIGAIIVGVFGKLIANIWLSARDRQDKEAEWRNHSIELTKLDLERKLKSRPPDDISPIRPSILDFLANYRDLKDLDQMEPKDLYLTIEEKRIQKIPKSNGGKLIP